MDFFFFFWSVIPQNHLEYTGDSFAAIVSPKQQRGSRCVKCLCGAGAIAGLHYAQQLGPLFSEGRVFSATGDVFMLNRTDLHKQLNGCEAPGGLRDPTGLRDPCGPRALTSKAFRLSLLWLSGESQHPSA